MAAKDIIEHQFPKGTSGNPNGRPKGSKNSKTILEKLLAGEETVKDKDGNIMRVSREEYMHLQQIRKAIKGDTRAYNAVLDRTEGAVKKEVELSGGLHTTLSESERASRLTEILNNGRARRAGQVNPDGSLDTERI